MCPHEPYIDGVEDKEFLSGADEKTIEIVKEKMEGRHEQSSDIFNKEEIKCLTGLYDSNLKYADGLVWALYEKLQALGVLNKTLIVITADHGENLGDHNLIGHGSDSWNSVVHTPLIIVYPSLIPKETKVKGLTESVDIMPTHPTHTLGSMLISFLHILHGAANYCQQWRWKG